MNSCPRRADSVFFGFRGRLTSAPKLTRHQARHSVRLEPEPDSASLSSREATRRELERIMPAQLSAQERETRLGRGGRFLTRQAYPKVRPWCSTSWASRAHLHARSTGSKRVGGATSAAHERNTAIALADREGHVVVRTRFDLARYPVACALEPLHDATPAEDTHGSRCELGVHSRKQLLRALSALGKSSSLPSQASFAPPFNRRAARAREPKHIPRSTRALLEIPR